MSATNRGSERCKDDAYYTPEWAVRALLQTVELPGGLWLEPACGTGNIIRAVEDLRPGRQQWDANDINPDSSMACLREFPHSTIRQVYNGDYLQTPPAATYSVAITNPPYSLALEFVQQAQRQASIVVMLLRLNWLGSKKRAEFLRGRMPNVYVLPKRPSFSEGATDSCEYGWFVWTPIAQDFGRTMVVDPEFCR